MRKAVIKYNNVKCGILTEDDNGEYLFEYEKEYIENHPNQFITFNPNKSLGTKFETDMEKEGHHICQTVHPTTFCF